MRKAAIVALVALLFGLFAAQTPVRRVGAEETAAGVRIVDSEFRPRRITVKAGATVTWKNEGRMAHTVTADDGSFESPTLGAGKTFSQKFAEAGTYRYYCAFHGGKDGDGMSGTVVVTR